MKDLLVETAKMERFIDDLGEVMKIATAVLIHLWSYENEEETIYDETARILKRFKEEAQR